MQEEEKRAQMRSEVLQGDPANQSENDPGKIAMWLPSFSHSSNQANAIQNNPKGFKNVRNNNNQQIGSLQDNMSGNFIDSGSFHN
jgi:hypothetical protein